MTSHDDTAVPAHDAADAELVLRTRSGDREAFGELWRRHYRSAITVARSVSSSFEPDDLVQEAYARIYQAILTGGGPTTGAFRAYLFTSIRNTAAGWGRTRRETAVHDLDILEDPATTDQATMEALDRGLTHVAFRSLPSRWQEVLWYSEVERMKPIEIAPLLGVNTSAVAQLTFRAREGLRQAWVQAHLRTVDEGSDCRWAIERLGAYALERLGVRALTKLEAHLGTCERCTAVASEAQDASSRLAFVLLPLTLGTVAGGAHLASLQGGSVSVVALAAMPSSVVQGAVTAGPAGTSVGSAATGATAGGHSGWGALAGLVAAGVVIVGGAVAGFAVLPGLLTGTSSEAVSVIAEPAPLASSAGPLASVLPTPADIADTTDVPIAPGSSPGPPQAEVEHDAPAVEGGPPAASAPLAAAPSTAPAASADPAAPSVPDRTVPTGPAQPLLPAGIPVITAVSTTVTTTATATAVPTPPSPTAASSPVDVTLQLTGAPAATVRVSLPGGMICTIVLDDSGTGAIALPTTIAAIRTNPLVEAWYVAGDLRGPSDPVGLRELTGPVLPAGTPAIVRAAAAVVSDEYDLGVTFSLQGEPGTIVQIALDGAAQTLTLDGAGGGTIVVHTTIPAVVFDPLVRVRYVEGLLSGPVSSMGLLSLLGYGVQEIPQP